MGVKVGVLMIRHPLAWMAGSRPAMTRHALNGASTCAAVNSVSVALPVAASNRDRFSMM